MKRRINIPDNTPKLSDHETNTDAHVLTFDENVNAFLSDNLKAGLTPDTNHFYANKIKRWKEYFVDLLGMSPPMAPKSSQIDAYEAYILNDRNSSLNGLDAHRRALKRFYGYMVDTGVCKTNPFVNRRPLKRQDIMIETFTSGELLRLLDVCDVKTFVGYRDYVIINLFLDTGVRLRELLDIKVSDFNAEDENVTILGKNGRHRTAPLSKRMVSLLNKWEIVRDYSPCDRLFISQNDTPLSKRGLQNRITKYGKKAGLSKQVSPHVFRHTFAKMYIQNGGNIFVLQDLLDHSTLDMVRRYVRLFSPDVKRDHAKFSPINRL